MLEFPNTRELIKRAGGREVVGRIFGITGQAVSLWYPQGVPGERVMPLCKAIEFKVTPHELRPDLYPHPQDGLPEPLRNQAAA